MYSPGSPHPLPDPMTITRVEPMSVAKIFATLYALFSLIFALPAGCIGAIGGAGAAMNGENPFAALGVAAILVIPLLAAVAGFIGGLIYGFLYNLVAGWVGGIEVEVDGDFGRSIL